MYHYLSTENCDWLEFIICFKFLARNSSLHCLYTLIWLKVSDVMSSPDIDIREKKIKFIFIPTTRFFPPKIITTNMQNYVLQDSLWKFIYFSVNLYNFFIFILNICFYTSFTWNIFIQIELHETWNDSNHVTITILQKFNDVVIQTKLLDIRVHQSKYFVEFW